MAEAAAPTVRTCALWVHEITMFEGDELVLSSAVFKGLAGGETIEVYHEEKREQGVVLVLRRPPQPLKRNMDLSMSRRIAQQFELMPRESVVVRVLRERREREHIELSMVELSFKDCYVGRADMFLFTQTLRNSCVYTQMRVRGGPFAATVNLLHNSRGICRCGLISERTRFVFRSRSAKMFLFIQVSREMFTYADDGFLYFERAVSIFLPELFERWREMRTSHSVYIMLFARSYLEETESDDGVEESVPVSASDSGAHAADLAHLLSQNHEAVRTDAYGRKYRDWYKMIVDDETKDEWHDTIAQLKTEMVCFPPDAPLQRQGSTAHDVAGGASSPAVKWRNSNASSGNVLEAINLALNLFDTHNIDRNLTRSGMDVVIITAGSGYFEVDAHLARLTKMRLVNIGIGVDIVSMGHPPLHVVPLFLALPLYEERASAGSSEHGSGDVKAISPLSSTSSTSSAFSSPLHGSARFKVPHWMYISYYSRPRPAQAVGANGSSASAAPAHQRGQHRSHHRLLPMLRPYLRMPGVSEGALRSQPAFSAPVIGPPDLASVPSPKRAGTLFATPGEGATQSGPSPAPSERIRASTPPRPAPPPPQRVPGRGSHDPSPSSSPSSFTLIMPEERDVSSSTSAPRHARNLNPFNYSSTPPNMSSTHWRWTHLFSPNTAPKEIYTTNASNKRKLYTSGPFWKSIVEPACLPLTTDYFPPPAVLERDYVESMQILSLLPNENAYVPLAPSAAASATGK